MLMLRDSQSHNAVQTDCSMVCGNFVTYDVLGFVLYVIGRTRMVLDSLRGEVSLTLRSHLSGGKGSVAWQHTQLFRQGADDVGQNPFDVKIFLKRP